MNAIFKQLEASGINSDADHFTRAVVRLTVYYTVGVCLILLVYSVLVYSLFSAQVEDTLNSYEQEESLFEEFRDEPFSHEIIENLFDILLITDGIVALLTVVVSYLLARRTLAPLRESYKKQQRFVADVAHELRTPLSVLKAGSELIVRKKRDVDEYVHFIDESREEVDRLIALSNDLLSVMKNGSREPKTFAHFSISDVCRVECTHMGPYAEDHGVSLTMDIEEGVMMQGHRGDFSRAILNLLKNAVDYTAPKGTVVLRLTKDQNHVHIDITDTGIGISTEDQAHIFERFYKVDVSRTQKPTSGSGLGLSIVQEIITAHGGTVTVQSQLGKGSTFRLDLPCA